MAMVAMAMVAIPMVAMVMVAKSGARAQARAFPLGPILKCGEEVKAECEQWFGVIGRRISVRDVASRVWQRKGAAAI